MFIVRITSGTKKMYFYNRAEAGKKLARALTKYRDQDIIIYALPRGGVVVAAEVASGLNAPLDLLIIRKIGHPNQPEYAICATSENGHLVCNEEELALVNKNWFKEAVEKEKQEAKRRRLVYLAGQKPHSAKGRVAIIVDDGIATGLTMKAAIKEIKHQQPRRIVVAVPIVPEDTAGELRQQVELIALDTPADFLGAVGSYYQSFPQVTDEEVIKIMRKYQRL